MKKKIYLAIIIIIIAIIFNTKYTQAYTYETSLRLETIQNISNSDLQNYIKSKYGSNNDTVILHPSGRSIISLKTTLKCLSKEKSSYNVQVGKRKKYKNSIRRSSKAI